MTRSKSLYVATLAHKKRKQRGDLLLESLIGMVLMAIIGMGVVFVTSKVSTSQQDMRIHEIIVNKLRADLIKNGTNGFDICSANLDFTLPTGQSVDVSAQGCGAPTTATINTVVVNDVPKPIFLMATYDTDVEIVVGGTWEVQ